MSEWIPAKKKPKIHEDKTFKISDPVLVTRMTEEGRVMDVLQWEVDGPKRKYWVDDTGTILDGVLAWMPLPDVYDGR